MDLALIQPLLEDEMYSGLALFLIAITVATTVLVVVAGLLHKLILTLRDINGLFSKKDYSKQVIIESKIAEYLRTIRHQFHADRVSIWQYKNGDKSISNVPFLKIFTSHETLSVFAKSIQMIWKDVPSNILGNLNRELFSGVPIIVPSLLSCRDEDKPAFCNDPDLRGFYQHLQIHDTKSIYMFPMYDADGRVFAAGVIEYTKDEHMIEDQWVQNAQSQFSAIGGIISGLAVKK